MVTAIDIPEAATRAAALGVSHRLPKPWREGDLEVVLNQALNSAQRLPMEDVTH